MNKEIQCSLGGRSRLSINSINNEQIATAESIVTKVPARHGQDVDQEITYYNCKLVKAEDTVIWYVASIPNKNINTFFRHGMFVLDTKSGDIVESKPQIYMLDFSGSQQQKVDNFSGKTSGTAMLNPDGNIINGKGKIEMTATTPAKNPTKNVTTGMTMTINFKENGK